MINYQTEIWHVGYKKIFNQSLLSSIRFMNLLISLKKQRKDYRKDKGIKGKIKEFFIKLIHGQLSAIIYTRKVHFVIYLFINLYQFIKFIYYIFPLF